MDLGFFCKSVVGDDVQLEEAPKLRYRVTAFAFLQRPYEVKDSEGADAPKNRSDVGSVVVTCYLGCRML